MSAVAETLKAKKAEFKPYPEYKDSGIEWLGKLPEHWEVKRLKNIASINSEVLQETTDPKFELQYVDISSVNSTGEILDTTEMLFEDAPSRARRIVRNSDTIISTVRTYLKAITFINNPSGNLIVSTGFAVLRPSEGVVPKYLFSLVRCEPFVEAVMANSVGVGYPAIAPTVLASLPAWIPPPEEQRAIASFLDRKTAKIDALISKKERLIELLKEKRTALISRAITKGLYPNVPMKDSGIEWVGEVPAHWGVQKLKHIAKVNLSNVDKKTNESESPVKLCNYLDVYYNDYITSDLNFMDATATPSQINKFILRKEDVLITKDSESWDDIAVSAYVPSDLDGVICGYHLAHIQPNTAQIKGEYLFQSFIAQGVNNQFKVAANGITRYGIGKYSIDNSLFLVPPLGEQRSIAAFLRSEIDKIDTLTAKICENIEKLREYRTALISATVTGKMDVRGAKA